MVTLWFEPLVRSFYAANALPISYSEGGTVPAARPEETEVQPQLKVILTLTLGSSG